jgi:hypothetical protein
MKTYVKKKVEARGKPCAKSPGIDEGFFNMLLREAIIPDERVTIKNECYKKNIKTIQTCKCNKEVGMLTKTWKIKNRVINDSSNPVYCGIPSKRAKRRSMIGSNIMSTANNRGGKIPYKNIFINKKN